MKKIIIDLLKKCDMFSPWPIFYSFRMSKAEKEVFDEVIKKSKEYLEFWSGGSTIRVLQKSKAKIYSVESSIDWLQLMRKYFIIRYFEGKRLSFFRINIGETKDWGFPVNNDSRELFPNYSWNIFTMIDFQFLDTILIDGRFRVACTINIIIHMYAFDNSNKIIIIHDFWNREYYHTVLNYLDVIGKTDTLGIFTIKKNLDIAKLKNDYASFKFDCR